MLFKKPQAVDAVVAAVLEIERYESGKCVEVEMEWLVKRYAGTVVKEWMQKHPRLEQNQSLTTESRVNSTPSVPVVPIHRVVVTTTKGSYEANFVAIQQHQETNSGKRFVVFATATYLHFKQLEPVLGETTAMIEFVKSPGAPSGAVRVPISLSDDILTFYMETDMPCLRASRFNFDNIEIGMHAVYQWHDGEGVKVSQIGYVQSATRDPGTGTGLVHTTCNINNTGEAKGEGCCGGILLLSAANRPWMPAAFHCLYDSHTGHNIAQMLPKGQIPVSPHLKSLFWQL
jgi:hypothetical protein